MQRRYDIDWIRVIAIGLLLVYHTAIGFQPWGGFIGFITNSESWESLWILMKMLNVWRIPILFYVSGMGLFLATKNRNWKQIFAERFLRLGIPLLFGSVAIVPISWFLLQSYYSRDISYLWSMGHLWFLGNILLYVVIITPLYFILKRTVAPKAILSIKCFLSSPFSLIIILLIFVLEAIIVKPALFEMYAFTFHGLALGFLAFLTGIIFMAVGLSFWANLLSWRWPFMLTAVVLYLVRVQQAPAQAPLYLLSIESNCWIMAILAFAYKYLNKKNIVLSYLKDAAYPVYIIHMNVLYLGAWLLYPLNINMQLKFAMQLAFTIIASLGLYELMIKRVAVLRVLFGLKKKKQ